ncbi:MAG: TraR/DksA family transcriptional regulator [Pseudomonadales bacterium]
MTATEDPKQHLLRLKAELEALEQSSQESTKPVVLDQTSVGRLSRMDAMQGQQMALEVARRRQQQLARIRRALLRIDRGEYGYCEACGEDIAAGRLAVDPAATHCVRCADG